MFSELVKRYCCDDISNIENYNVALTDSEIWEVHHRRETHDENGNVRTQQISKIELIKQNLYYSRPSSELIFMSRKNHRLLHMNNNEFAKGKIIGNQNAKGNVLSEKTRKQMGESRKGNINNGVAYIRCIETNEIHRTREWIELGYPNAYNVAKGRQKTCRGLHFEYV